MGHFPPDRDKIRFLQQDVDTQCPFFTSILAAKSCQVLVRSAWRSKVRKTPGQPVEHRECSVVHGPKVPTWAVYPVGKLGKLFLGFVFHTKQEQVDNC